MLEIENACMIFNMITTFTKGVIIIPHHLLFDYVLPQINFN